MEYINSTLFDVLSLSNRKFYNLENFNFSKSEHSIDYNSLLKKLDDNNKEELKNIKYWIEQHCEDVAINNCIKMLNFGIKIGMELQLEFLKIDGTI